MMEFRHRAGHSHDVVVIGAGPAGLAAATEACAQGLDVLLLDEQPAPGGQIYRAVEDAQPARPEAVTALGPDYTRGAALVEAFRRSGADYRPGTAVWRVDPDGSIACSRDGRAFVVKARRIIAATGAMERPVPVPGWTLPGVMAAGAAQVLLKSAGLVPAGRVVLAGSGPLLLLVARQLVAAGADVAAVLETTSFRDYLRAARHLPRALRASNDLRKGLAMRRRIRNAGVPIRSGIRDIAALGTARLERVCFGTAEIAADLLLLHDGVIPNLQLTRQIGCIHEWHAPQRCWRPVLDRWGGTSLPVLAVAGDAGGILGAEAAVLSGRLAALDSACRLGAIGPTERDRLAAPLRRSLARRTAIRPLLDALFRPNPAWRAPPDDATIVCRCEEVAAGAIRAGLALGATGPNQLKAFTRCGMGPCQGRMCGPTVAEIVAATRGIPVAEAGHYRIRPPIKPVTLGELAALDS